MGRDDTRHSTAEEQLVADVVAATDIYMLKAAVNRIETYVTKSGQPLHKDIVKRIDQLIDAVERHL